MKEFNKKYYTCQKRKRNINLIIVRPILKND